MAKAVDTHPTKQVKSSPKTLKTNTFFVESTNIEIATFPYKTSPPETNVKAYIMRSAKWTYHKEVLSDYTSDYLFNNDVKNKLLRTNFGEFLLKY